mmetsp:Transcript_13044/g.26445  ORF Transcript_13044/g.26445 Transcript_13044/m.26445 type:complete len:888 (-) Transcript_13044:4032-6695(-)|eukprot:CAMPEP_0184679770 /NCGR_PEP_ID=MMETSP0312-20130426/2638_1 /TAXON_ID=31354 /ORGANISM="Compsopogon coeruleus, Strain SAG 36.94" /LENGTH=887 /DNA_ID=CAMNT_0027129447 /DNA_START=68 /DNA_END=2731 /DNA_ORIENTATION=-
MHISADDEEEENDAPWVMGFGRSLPMLHASRPAPQKLEIMAVVGSRRGASRRSLESAKVAALALGVCVTRSASAAYVRHLPQPKHLIYRDERPQVSPRVPRNNGRDGSWVTTRGSSIRAAPLIPALALAASSYHVVDTPTLAQRRTWASRICAVVLHDNPAISFISPGGLLNRLAYRLDLWLETNPGTYFLVLLVLTATWVLFGAIVYYFVSNRDLAQQEAKNHHHRLDEHHPVGNLDLDETPILETIPGKRVPFLEALWKAWSCLASSSTHTKEKRFPNRLVALMLTIGGLLSWSITTGTISATMKERLEVLRRGTILRPVLEDQHIIVVGSETSGHIYPLLKQLNQSVRFAQKDKEHRLGILAKLGLARMKQTVVLFSGEPAARMEYPVTNVVKSGRLDRLRILNRRGQMSDSKVFFTIGADRAKQVVVLAPQLMDPYDGDSQTIGALLALQATKSNAEVIVEASKASSGQLAERLCGGSSLNSVTVVKQDLAPKLIAQCALQSGLSKVIYELLSHSGTVFNVREYSSLVGLPYGIVRDGFRDAIVCGILSHDNVDFHPDDTKVLNPGDKVMVLAPKRSHRTPPPELEQLAAKVPFGNLGLKQNGKRRTTTKPSSNPNLKKELILLMGWSRESADMMIELDRFVGAKSKVVVVSNVPVAQRQLLLQRKIEREATYKNNPGGLRKLSVDHVLGNPASRTDLLRAMKRADIVKAKFQRVSAVAVADDTSNTKSLPLTDNLTAMSALLTDTILSQIGIPATVSAELRNGSLARQLSKTHPEINFVAVPELMGLLTAMVVEHPNMNDLWSHLLVSSGSELYVKDARRYFPRTKSTQAWSFHDAKERAHDLGEVALGIHRRDGRSWEPILNPDPSTHVREDDRIIVIAVE